MTVHGSGEPEGSRRATDGLDWGRSTFEPALPGGEPPVPAPAPAYPPAPPPAVPQAFPVRPRFGMATVLGIAGASAIVAGLVAGIVVALVFEKDDSRPATAALSGSAKQVTVVETSAVADVALKTRPSVVRIESTIKSGAGSERDVGSGVVLDAAGHIVTNAHVVLNTDTLKVILPNGDERLAILIGHDYPFTDVAVLQVGPGGLRPIEIGDSSALTLGQTVIAIGNPLAEFDGSVTVGIVSGLNRVRTFDAVRSSDLIQTDAAVNNGNSGGALVNLEGQFVGMPTAVLRQSRSGAPVEGIAFALPSNRVLEIANAIIRNGGSPVRPTLGLEHLDISDEVTARIPRLAVQDGAVVISVAKGGPAEAAKIEAGDILTSVGGIAVTRNAPLLNALAKLSPEQAVKVVLNRQGKIIEAEVRLGKR